MSELLSAAIEKTKECALVFAKFLSPNDTGLTGGHQCGIYIPKNSVRLIFDGLFERGFHIILTDHEFVERQQESGVGDIGDHRHDAAGVALTFLAFEGERRRNQGLGRRRTAD